MEANVGANSGLDLSHLTEEEQETILQVLLRDLDLRRQDEGRVRMLAQTEADAAQLHSQSGAWFREASSRRHRGRVCGSDLVRATIRRRPTKSRWRSAYSTLSGGMMSLFSSGVFGVAEVRGRLQFSLAYDGHKGELRVKVHRCEDISAAADEHRSDP